MKHNHTIRMEKNCKLFLRFCVMLKKVNFFTVKLTYTPKQEHYLLLLGHASALHFKLYCFIVRLQ